MMHGFRVHQSVLSAVSRLKIVVALGPSPFLGTHRGPRPRRRFAALAGFVKGKVAAYPDPPKSTQASPGTGIAFIVI